MTTEQPRYDVAISFLSRDESIATAIHRKLSESLEVFFYPRQQEALAGTDGLSSMREPFFDHSRLNVVLYRDPWGKTPWTRIEETAIKESCLEFGWERLFFIVLDQNCPLPSWLPRNLVRFNYAEFGIDQAAGAIKARVQENGGTLKPSSALKRAEMLRNDELFRQQRAAMSTPAGSQQMHATVIELFAAIETRCLEISSKGYLPIRCSKEINARSAAQSCYITDGRVGMTITWDQPFSNSLSKSGLFVRQFQGGLILHGELGMRVYIEPPRQVDEKKYSADLSRAGEHGWTEEDGSEFLTASVLSERCVIELLDLADHFRKADL